MVRIEATDNSSSSNNNLGLVPNLQIANLVIIITINYYRIFLKFFKQAVPPLGSSFMLISYIDVLLTYNFQAVFYFLLLSNPRRQMYIHWVRSIITMKLFIRYNFVGMFSHEPQVSFFCFFNNYAYSHQTSPKRIMNNTKNK